jgi:hypothetical protein
MVVALSMEHCVPLVRIYVVIAVPKITSNVALSINCPMFRPTSTLYLAFLILGGS